MENEKDQVQYIYYGTKCDSNEVEAFLEHIFTVNFSAEQEGRRKTPVCIWGDHGIGKTETVEGLAKKKGYKWAYIAPAQFEEMGDLLGMPRITGESNGKADATEFVAPEWVPRKEGPGVLLIDDVNRADDRILRGIMQLLQNFELVSWKMPPKWQIVLTANPDGGDYSVTPMDDAMLTRMMHITMVFDVKRWAQWAELNGVDSRGINFVLSYPELVKGSRTTPRTLTQFFESLRPIQDLEKELNLVRLLADASLDSETATVFLSFVQSKLAKLISPEEILQTRNFEEEVIGFLAPMMGGELRRVDILSVVSTRLMNHLHNQKDALSARARQNVIQFILMDLIPGDMRLSLALELSNSSNQVLADLISEPEISMLILETMS